MKKYINKIIMLKYIIFKFEITSNLFSLKLNIFAKKKIKLKRIFLKNPSAGIGRQDILKIY